MPSSLRRHRTAQSGFTLIELLVVIAIIAILAAILFPVFAQAREKARQSSCLSNLNQIGKSLMMYTQDYDEIMPRAWQGGGSSAQPYGTAGHYKWMDAVFPYTKNEQIFNCPSHSTNFFAYTYMGGSNPTAVNSGNRYGSYVLNAAYWGGGDNQSSPSGASMAAVATPAGTLWVADGTGPSTFETSWENANTVPTPGTSKPRTMYNLIERHQETTSVLFCDGHVKSMRLASLAEQHTVGSAQVLHYFTIEDD